MIKKKEGIYVHCITGPLKPDFVRYVNTISTLGGGADYADPHCYSPPGFSDIPTALYQGIFAHFLWWDYSHISILFYTHTM